LVVPPTGMLVAPNDFVIVGAAATLIETVAVLVHPPGLLSTYLKESTPWKPAAGVYEKLPSALSETLPAADVGVGAPIVVCSPPVVAPQLEIDAPLNVSFASTPSATWVPVR